MHNRLEVELQLRKQAVRLHNRVERPHKLAGLLRKLVADMAALFLEANMSLFLELASIEDTMLMKRYYKEQTRR